MRYRTLQYITLIIILMLLFAAGRGDLTLYIHPRYIVFTIVFVVIGLMMFMTVLANISTRDNDGSKKYLSVYASIPLYLFVLCVLLLAPSDLSQSLASSRSSSSQQNSVEKTKHSTLDSFSTDLTRFTISDWNNVLASSPTDDQINDKDAKIEGFLYTDDSGQLFIARFRLTCCAVDATPLAIPLIPSPDVATYESGSWIAITGSFTKVESELHPWQISLSTTEQIEEPNDPYIF
jgi:putative membrane protein